MSSDTAAGIIVTGATITGGTSATGATIIAGTTAIGTAGITGVGGAEAEIRLAAGRRCAGGAGRTALRIAG